MFFWVDTSGESSEEDSPRSPSSPLSGMIPKKVVAKLESRRKEVSSPTRKKRCTDDDDDEAQPPPSKPVPLTCLPEDVARQLFREDGWFEASDLLRLRVSKALHKIVGPRPSLLLRHALPAFNAWRSKIRRQPHRPRYNASFRRSRRRHDRAVLLF